MSTPPSDDLLSDLTERLVLTLRDFIVEHPGEVAAFQVVQAHALALAEFLAIDSQPWDAHDFDRVGKAVAWWIFTSLAVDARAQVTPALLEHLQRLSSEEAAVKRCVH